MNPYWEQLQAKKAKEKRRDIKIGICIAVVCVLITGIMCYEASRYFAHSHIADVNQPQQALNQDDDGGIHDGRILLIGIVVLAVLSGLIAPVVSGGRYSYTQMLTVTLVLGALNFFVGKGLWYTNNPDPQDCLSFSLGFCGALAIMDFIFLLIIAAYGWAERKDNQP